MSESSSSSKALKSGVWYTVSSFLTRGIAVITTPIFTRLLTKGEVGDFSNFTSWLSVLGIICTFDLFSSVTVARYDYSDNIDEYISSNLVLGSLITLVFYIVTLFRHEFWLKLFSFSEVEYFSLFTYLMVYPALQMLQVKSRVTYRYRLSTLLSIVSAICSSVVSLICVVISENRYYGRLLGYIIPLFFVNLFIYFYLLFKGKRVSTQYWRYSLIISFPLIWHSLANSILNSSDRVMIKQLCSAEDAALYTIAYTCSIVVQILWSSLNTAWSPWAFEKMNENDKESLKTASKPYLLFFGFIVICFLLVSPEILLLMGGSAYESSLSVIPPVMIAYVFQFTYSLYINIEYFFKKQFWIAGGTVIAAAINVILNFIFIPIYGYIAAAYTTLAGYVILFVIHFLIVIRLDKSYFYDSKFIIKYLIFFMIAMVGTLLLYKNLLVRYILLGTIIVYTFGMLIKHRKTICCLVKKKEFLTLIFQLEQWLIPVRNN